MRTPCSLQFLGPKENNEPSQKLLKDCKSAVLFKKYCVFYVSWKIFFSHIYFEELRETWPTGTIN